MSMSQTEQALTPELRRERIEAAVARLPRVQLAHLPTPLEELPRLSAAIGGPRIFIYSSSATT